MSEGSKTENGSLSSKDEVKRSKQSLELVERDSQPEIKLELTLKKMSADVVQGVDK